MLDCFTNPLCERRDSNPLRGPDHLSHVMKGCYQTGDKGFLVASRELVIAMS